MARQWRLLLSCEHGGARIPAAYRSYLSSRDKSDLATHKGWDLGALAVAHALQQQLKCPLLLATTSRLLVDLNRSAHHRSCLGPAFRDLPEEVREDIFASYYWPYRQQVDMRLRRMLAPDAAVLHVAVHSFTPVWNGELRTADIGLLYDPGRPSEKRWADWIMQRLKRELPTLRLRRNYPYLGKADGLTRALRCEHSPRLYAGFELEINQSLLTTVREQRALARALAAVFAAI